MTVLYVASDQPGAGKTSICIALAEEMRQRGQKVVAVKPISGASDHDGDEDNTVFSALLAQSETIVRLPAEEGRMTKALLDQVVARCRDAGRRADILIVEGSAKLSPEASRQIVDALDAKVLLVTGHEHGRDGASLTSWAQSFGDRLIGLIVNSRTRHMATEVRNVFQPGLASAGLNVVGVVPEDRRLLGVTVDQIRRHLEGEYMQGEEFANRLVEHFMVGGMGLDWGVLYFGIHDRKCVIVRGNRPDVQMAALHTPTTCIVLTEDEEPVEYILHEANLEDVPLILVKSSTLETMSALNTIQDEAKFDHPDKVARMRELLREHTDLAVIYAGLGILEAARVS